MTDKSIFTPMRAEKVFYPDDDFTITGEGSEMKATANVDDLYLNSKLMVKGVAVPCAYGDTFTDGPPQPGLAFTFK